MMRTPSGRAGIFAGAALLGNSQDKPLVGNWLLP